MNGTKTKQVRPENFVDLLVSAGRSPEIPESEDVYGWLVGSWELEVLHYRAVNLVGQGLRGEAHFSWALEGRAIQEPMSDVDAKVLRVDEATRARYVIVVPMAQPDQPECRAHASLWAGFVD